MSAGHVEVSSSFRIQKGGEGEGALDYWAEKSQFQLGVHGLRGIEKKGEIPPRKMKRNIKSSDPILSEMCSGGGGKKKRGMSLKTSIKAKPAGEGGFGKTRLQFILLERLKSEGKGERGKRSSSFLGADSGGKKNKKEKRGKSFLPFLSLSKDSLLPLSGARKRREKDSPLLLLNSRKGLRPLFRDADRGRREEEGKVSRLSPFQPKKENVKVTSLFYLYKEKRSKKKERRSLRLTYFLARIERLQKKRRG